ncbi:MULTISPECIES: cyclic nucleotide-binding domain-containing protein [Bradyrhizobium]|uniref:cyclic nucleotide-binding domain-containing protein n=1 Tax=Bradyrhizobium TaxID=374 RepID=UPI002011DD14|nr:MULTISPECIES: cyclic nucleotide-binding domain-containing protein [Bradyrhizobium]
MDLVAISETLVRRMSAISGLTEEELAAISDLPITVRRFPPDHSIVRDGDRPSDCCLIASGFGVRSKTTASGQRQILSIHIPGEIPDLQSLHLHVME